MPLKFRSRLGCGALAKEGAASPSAFADVGYSDLSAALMPGHRFCAQGVCFLTMAIQHSDISQGKAQGADSSTPALGRLVLTGNDDHSDSHKGDASGDGDGFEQKAPDGRLFGVGHGQDFFGSRKAARSL